MNVWAEDIDKLITNPDANREVKEYLHKFLKGKIYFTKKDIDDSLEGLTFKATAIKEKGKKT